MCPKLKEGVCEVGGIEPEHIECVDNKHCFSAKWELCRIYIVGLLFSSNENFVRLHGKEVTV
jgi:hypothetical protein